jgi:hypothetical protein
MAKPKQQKPQFDISDLLGFLNQPKVKAATNLSQGKLTSQDVMGLTGGGQSKAAPYSDMLAQATNQKVKNDYETAKFLADWYTPFSEGQRLVQGKSEPMDPIWAAMSIFPFGKAAKKLKNVDKETKMLLDVLRSSKPLRNQVAGSNSGSGPYEGQYSPMDILLMQLYGG